VEHKNATRVEIKSASEGTFSAVFCTTGVVDHDGDEVMPGAIKTGITVPLSVYNHGSWNPGAPPVGKARVSLHSNEYVAEGRFFLGSAAARDTFETVKELAVDGIGSWSWGFDVTDHQYIDRAGQRVKLLKSVRLHEISPVMRAASLGTRTLSAKSYDDDTTQDTVCREYGRFIKSELEQVVADELADIHNRLELQDEMRRIARNHFGGWYGY
jgi:HK97 family phage prohead protease